MDRLDGAIQRLAHEFDTLTHEISSTVQSVADAERERSLASLAAAQAPHGVLAAAEQARDQLRHVIAEYRRFVGQVDQLEQVWLISEDLKRAVKDLQKQ